MPSVVNTSILTVLCFYINLGRSFSDNCKCSFKLVRREDMRKDGWIERLILTSGLDLNTIPEHVNSDMFPESGVASNWKQDRCRLIFAPFSGYEADILQWIENQGFAPAMIWHLFFLAPSLSSEIRQGYVFAMGADIKLPNTDPMIPLIRGNDFLQWAAIGPYPKEAGFLVMPKQTH